MGFEVRFNNPAGPEYAFLESFRKARLVWPNAVIENADTGELILDPDNETFAGMSGVMIYKDMTAHASWGSFGAIASNLSTMIHILASWYSLTVVFDNPENKDVQIIISAIRSFLSFFERPIRVTANSSQA